MTKSSKIQFDFDAFIGQPRYFAFEELLDLLLENGNELASENRWGSNPTGYIAILKYPIDFDLIEERFDVPKSVVLNREQSEIDYGLGTVIIRQL